MSNISFNKCSLLGDTKSAFLSKLIPQTALKSDSGRAVTDNDYALKIFGFFMRLSLNMTVVLGGD